MVAYLWYYLRDSLSAVTNFGHFFASEVVKVTGNGSMVAVSGHHSYVSFAALDL